MARYLVERTFPDGLHIPRDSGGAAVCAAVVKTNATEEVTRVHS